jgi:cell division transport system permease protein
MAVTRNTDAITPVRSSSKFNIWLTGHASASLSALGRLSRQPFASLMIILVIGVTLALPTAINVIVKNVQSISDNWNNAIDFSVYLKQDLSIKDAEDMANLIKQRADIELVDLITADEALLDFKQQSGFGEALNQLSKNPLPHALIIRPSPDNTGASLALLQEEIGNLPETELVQFDTEWVQRFHAILDIIKQAISIGTVLLGIAIVVIVGNTIRLDIENKREEIEVTKLVGAGNAFIRRPFLWTGFWHGLLGGIFALLIVQYGLYLLREPASRLVGLYQDQGKIAVTSLTITESSTIIGLAIVLGLFASWVTTARYMRQIEPR